MSYPVRLIRAHDDSDPECVIAFVHLGDNPAPIAAAMAKYAGNRLPTSPLVLVTDRVERWADRFPGLVIPYSRDRSESWLRDLEKKYPERRIGSGGYWISTLERLFALRRVAERFPNAAVLQLETDVFSFVDEDLLGVLRENVKTVAVPRTSPTMACASIMFAANGGQLQVALNRMSHIAAQADEWFTDMQLLSTAIDIGVLCELPTLPGSGFTLARRPESIAQAVRHREVIFDGLALGQYLFGQDPFHTGGRRISGYQLPDFASPLADWRWTADRQPWPSLLAEYAGTELRIANVHIHAKVDPGAFEWPLSPLWRQALEEANGERDRTAGHFTPDLIHSQPLPLWVRAKVVRREGLGYAFRRVRDRLYRQSS